MVTLPERALVSLIGAALAVAVFTVAPVASAGIGELPLDPCYNGLTPFNPYADNCALQPRPPHALGAAPDQTAILNCSVGSQLLRGLCLSQYVNGGPGYYP